MVILFPMLACGSMRPFSAGDLAVFYSILGAWLLSLLLVFVNPFLISRLSTSRRSKSRHTFFWVIYTVSVLAVLAQGLDNMGGMLWLIPIFVLPNLVIAHFVALLFALKRSRAGSK
jgi:hypothetical protein